MLSQPRINGTDYLADSTERRSILNTSIYLVSSCLSCFISSIFCCFFFFFFSLFLSDTSASYGSTSNASIFSLRDKEGLAPFKSMVKSKSNAIYKGERDGPTFGKGYPYDIHIANNASSNTYSHTQFSNTYTLPSGVQDRDTILAGTDTFSPDEVEVFYLG